MPLPIRFSFTPALLAVGWIGFCALPRPALAEVVLLKSGARVEGEILNPARSKDDVVQVVPVEGLKLTLDPLQVKGVLVQTKILKDYEADVAKMADTLEAHLSMAQWCLEVGLSEQRKFHLGQVIKHDPNHALARAALGYLKVGSGWMTRSEDMRRQGYVYKADGYRLPQELEIAERARQWELDTKAWRKNLKMWFTWLEGKGKGKGADQALENIRGIREEAAAPALAEAVADPGRRRDLRLLCLDVLMQFPPSYHGFTLVTIARDDPDDEMSDKCLDILREQRSQQALLTFVKGLKSKNNQVVNRSARCLQRLGNPAATVPLIDALVTKHDVTIQTGSPGGVAAGFGGSSNDNGLGNFSMGDKSKTISRELNNDSVLGALTSLHQGVNFQFNEAQWKAWYVSSHTSPDVDLRRGE
jgi:hypothetical protein